MVTHARLLLLLLFFFLSLLCVADVLLEKRHNHYGSLLLSVCNAMMDDHIALRMCVRRKRAGEYTLGFF
jgi:hypothetical protein